MAKSLTPTKQVATPNLLIYTDLDGTLLDHHDYNFAAAEETIELINQLGIAWIFNTSKTLTELLAYSIYLYGLQ